MNHVSRIVLVVRRPLGGAFRHVCDLAALLQGHGVAAGLVCGAADPALIPRLRGPLELVFPLGVAMVAMPAAAGPGDLAGLWASRRFVRRVGPDLIHGHGAKGGLYARLLGRSLGIPALYTAHGGSLHYAGSWLGRAAFFPVERALLRWSAAIVFESAFAERRFCAAVGPPRCPSRVIYNGLAPAEFAPPEAAPEVDFVYVGELRRLKGVDLLVEAAALLARAGRPVRVAIHGSGPYEARLRRLAAERGLAGGLCEFGAPIYPGRLALARGRCAVIPSRAESLPYVMVEAAAMGIPVIAARVGGIPEIVGPALADRLVRPDDPAALADAMRDALDDPAGHARRAAQLRERVRAQFGEARMAEQMLALYDAVGGGAGAPEEAAALGRAGARPG